MDKIRNLDYYIETAYSWIEINKCILQSERARLEDDDDIWDEILADDYSLRDYYEEELNTDPQWAEWLERQIKADLSAHNRIDLARLLARKFKEMMG